MPGEKSHAWLSVLGDLRGDAEIMTGEVCLLLVRYVTLYKKGVG